jgi:hypothetical protein
MIEMLDSKCKPWHASGVCFYSAALRRFRLRIFAETHRCAFGSRSHGFTSQFFGPRPFMLQLQHSAALNNR